jgi:tetratricopeptide (TPR) repeat protein
MARTPAALVRQLVEQGSPDEARALLQAALPASRGGERAELLLAAAALSAHEGDYATGLEQAVEAGEISDAARDQAGLCTALAQAGAMLRAAGDNAAAVQTLAQAEQLARHLADPLRLAQVLRSLGVAGSLLGRHDDALGALQEAVALFEGLAADDEARLARLSLQNARSRQLEGRHVDDPERRKIENAALVGEWAQLAQALSDAGHRRLALMAWGNHAITLHRAGQPEEAAAALQGLLLHYRELGMRPNEGLTQAELARCRQTQGQTLPALAHAREAVRLLREAGTQDDLLEALGDLARIALDAGDDETARAADTERRALSARRDDETARRALERRRWRLSLGRLAVEVPGTEPGRTAS